MSRLPGSSRSLTSGRGLGGRTPLARVIAVVGVGLLAPIAAVAAANLPVSVTLLATSATALLLVVLWSAEASFYVLIFSMLLSPEFVVAELGGAGVGDRGLTLRGDDFVILMIALAWLVRIAVFKEAGIVRRNPLNTPIFAYIGACALSTTIGMFAGRVNLVAGSLFVLKYFEYMVVYFLVVNFVDDRDQIRRLLTAALITAVIVSVVAIAQIPSGERISAPFEGEQGEPNTLGAYLVLWLAVTLSFFAQSREIFTRVFWASLAALMIVPLIYTYSRTSWLAFVFMLASLTLLHRGRTVFIAIGSLGLIVLLLFPPQAIVERASYTLAEEAARGSISIGPFIIEPSAAARIESWLIAGEATLEHPVLGWGVTGHSFQDSQYARALIETGIVGMLLLAWLFVRLWSVGQRLSEEADSGFEEALAPGFLAGFVGLVVHGIGANTFIVVRIMEPFWLLAGLVVVSTLLKTEDDDEVETTEPERRQLLRPLPHGT